jgi:hypothetical protein
MVGSIRISTSVAIAVAIAALGIGALTGCTAGSAAAQRTPLTAKAAGAYYATTTCDLDAAEEAFSVALLNAQQSTESTGPDLDSLTGSALAYQKASRAAVDHLTDKGTVWPGSIRKPLAVLVAELRALDEPLGAMAAGKQMADEQAGYRGLPDNSDAAAAVKDIRAKLDVPSDSCPAPAPAANTAAPAAGIVISGSGYAFHAPAGWTPPQRPVQADAYAISAEPDAAGVYDTVNVLLGAPSTDSLPAQQRNAAQYLEQAVGATQVKIRPRIEIAGDEAVHLSSLQSHQGVTVWSEQYSVTHGGTGVTVTFDFHENESQADREALADSVLAAWTWA